MRVAKNCDLFTREEGHEYKGWCSKCAATDVSHACARVPGKSGKSKVERELDGLRRRYQNYLHDRQNLLERERELEKDLAEIRRIKAEAELGIDRTRFAIEILVRLGDD